MKQTPAELNDLTPREAEIEKLLCQGYSGLNVASLLGCTQDTVSVHTMHIYRKRRVHSQIGLLLDYLDRKGINPFPKETT
jgi:DNA-binding CsgD family transcriptional regulator